MFGKPHSLRGPALLAVLFLLLGGGPVAAQAIDEGFRFDPIEGGAEPSSNWTSVKGGSRVIYRPERKDGAGCQLAIPPGQVEFTEVEVVGPFVSGGTRAEMLEWINGWASSEGERVDATLEILDEPTAPVRTIDYFDCIPLRYEPPPVRAGDDSLLEERFFFKPERVETSYLPPVPPITPDPVEPLPGGAFVLELNGEPLPVIAVTPGAMVVESRGPRGFGPRAIVTWETWRVERYYGSGTGLADLFQSAMDEHGRSCPLGDGSLLYLDPDGAEARRIDFFGFTPIHYEPIAVDARNPGQAAVEILEFRVTRCEYS